jgi:hypothetical protein
VSTPAEKLRDPEALYEPPDFDQETLNDLVGALTPELGRAFARQMMEALHEARSVGDLRPVNRAFESWWRTLVFETRPRFDEFWDEVSREDIPRLDQDALNERRNRRVRA